MKDFSTPNIVASRCLGFEHCRWNGQIISADMVQELKGHVEFITVCPEAQIGLGVPRDPVRIVMKDGERRLIQPETNKDVTEDMNEFVDDFIENLNNNSIDGFILKSRSPSCGIKDTKIYPDTNKSAPIAKESGFFGKAILDNYPYIAIESEGRLRNHQIREHFLTKVFTFADFRNMREKGKSSLMEFHDHHGLLIKSYDHEIHKKMDALLSEETEQNPPIEIYEQLLQEAFSNPPRCQAKIKIMEDLFHSIEDKLNQEEKDFFIEALDDYLDGKNSLNVPLSIVITHLMRFDKKDITQHSFFYPYPKELVKLEDIKTCQTRDYWPF